MKYIISFIVLVLIIVLPALSWYYLRSGYDFRLDLIQKLEAKKLIDADLESTDGLSLKTTLGHKTSLIVDKFKANLRRVEDVHDQFDQAFTYQTVFVSNELCDVVQKPLQKCLQLDANVMHELLDGHAFAIIDTNMQVRNWYDDADTSYQKMVEHMAVVLPRVPNKDIIEK